MQSYTVQVTLFIEEDDPDAALAAAHGILTDAGGSDTYEGGSFGFALGPVAPDTTRP